MTDAILTIVTIMGATAIIIVLAYVGFSTADDRGMCENACGHVRSRLIDGVCHCATQSGYARHEGAE